MLANANNSHKITHKLVFLMTTILAFLLYSFVLLLPKLTREAIEPSQKICEEPLEQVCPTCGSEHVIKNGSTHNGKPKYQCKICGHQFITNPTNSPVSEETKQLIDRLLIERISLRGIARVAEVSWSWLQDYVNQKLAQTSRQTKVLVKSPGKLVLNVTSYGHLLIARKIRFIFG